MSAQDASGTLLRGGVVVNHDGSSVSDVLVSSLTGKVVAVQNHIDLDWSEKQVGGPVFVMECAGLVLVPGGIDPHTHFSMPFMGTVTVDDWESGSKDAIAGGTTSVVDFIIPGKKQPYLDAFHQWQKNAEKSLCNYSFHCAVVRWDQNTEQELLELGKKGVTSFKHFLAYKNALMVDGDLLKSFQNCQNNGYLAMVHAENGEIIAFNQANLASDPLKACNPKSHALAREDFVEYEAVERSCAIANVQKTPLVVVHNTCQGSIKAIQRAKSRGQRVYTEVTIAHLTLDNTRYDNPSWDIAAHHVLSPPLRDKSQVENLWMNLRGGLVDFVASDHCTFTTEQKRAGKTDFRLIPNGCPGVGERMLLLWDKGVRTKEISMEQFVSLTSFNAARVYGLSGKGVVRAGSDGDIAVLAPGREHAFGSGAGRSHSRVDVSVYAGMRAACSIHAVLVNGRLAYSGMDDSFITSPGSGKFIPRKPFSGSPFE
eukprot:TRINITY_DN13950_c0_g1_i1.p1 TRINITY_DN13950_c0_g1~~TRINITY_DN13950_c0_g1_i1.p1  ORF type:complete len:483 (+),score=65.08 TRINITY_DN13950_c0_g1_i1:11-1459(+)